VTLSEYIAEANSVLSPPLSGPELRWAANAMYGGIEPQRFAGWLALTASSPLLPLAPAAERSPLPDL
jgi:hypothetical protein